MLKKYIPFFILGPLSNILWAGWVLPEIGEQGTRAETIQWIAVQAVLPVLFILFIRLRWRFIYWVLMIYSGFVILFSIGVLGWALTGTETPLSVYLVCLILFVMGFGILYHALKDLNIGSKERKDYAKD